MAAETFTYSGNVYTAGVAGTTDFALISSAAKAIEYLEPSHIHVYTSANEGASWTELTRPAQWDFISSGTSVRLASGIAAGTWVKVQRITPNQGQYVNFQAGSLLTAEQLNDEARSNAYVNQETSDTLGSTLTSLQSAQVAIENAIAVIGGLTAFTQVANVAAIPSSPSTGDAVEILDSTGIENFTPLTGVPVNFVGEAGLTARIVYNEASSSWVWLGYGVQDPESRYAPTESPTFTGTVTIPSGASIAGYAPIQSPTFTGTVTIPSGASIDGYVTLGTTQTFTAVKTFAASQAYPRIPQNSQGGAYTLVQADAGKHIAISTGGITIPASVFDVGDAISIYNSGASSQTITQGSGVTLRQSGTSNTGNRTLAQYGICTILCVAGNTFVISGAGLS